MNIQEKTNLAYEIGYSAALSRGECVFAFNKEALALIDGNKVGSKENILVMESFTSGVRGGSYALFEKLLAE